MVLNNNFEIGLDNINSHDGKKNQDRAENTIFKTCPVTSDYLNKQFVCCLFH